MLNALIKDRVKDTTTTTGTGDITLSGTAPSGFVSFNTAYSTTREFPYIIEGGGEWECGIGLLSASTTMTRKQVVSSSNAGSTVNFSAGTKNVFSDYLSTHLQRRLVWIPKQQCLQMAASFVTIHDQTWPAVVGTGTFVGSSLGTGSLKASTPLLRLTSAATANSASEIKGTHAWAWRGNAAGRGGFCCEFIWSVNSAVGTVANQRGGIGLFNTTSALPTNAAPSAQVDCVFMGWDAAESTMRIRHNDNAGTCTAVDLGANFPVDTTSVYRTVFWCFPNDTVLYYEVTRLDTGDVATGVISTNLPTSTQFMCPHFWMNNGGTAAAVVLDFRSFINFWHM